MKDIVIFAREVLEMHYRIIELEVEHERLLKIEKQYDELLMSSIRHGEHMTGALLTATLNGNIVEKTRKAGE